jgi:hypothetical protein
VRERCAWSSPGRVSLSTKTVADCFKYRNKIGLDVALEALRDCYRDQKASLDETWQAARACRVANVIRPYMESLAWLAPRPRTRTR